MKRFTVLTAILSLVVAAGWAFFQAVSDSKASPERKYDNTPILVYDGRAEMEKAIRAGDENRAISEANTAWPTVYDITGALPGAINLERDDVTTKPVIVYDATGAMLDAIQP